MNTRAVVALVVAAAALGTLSCLKPAGDGGGDYGARLRALTDGPPKMTDAMRARVRAAPALSLEEGFGGLRFGSSMQAVVDLWGRPREIWFKSENRIQLTIAASTFEFVDDKLVEVSIHHIDIPELALADGKLKAGAPMPDLLQTFPGATLADDGDEKDEVELPSGVIVKVDEYNGEVIAITVEKPPVAASPSAHE